jgi:hypothetical protein
MAPDINELIYIFYSNYTSGVDTFLIGLVKLALSEKVVFMEKIAATDKTTYDKHVDYIYAHKNKIDFGGGPQEVGHQALKLIAADYFKSKNIPYKFEKEFCGRYIDVASSDLSIIIECGNTDPEKIFDYFSGEQTKETLILPYPSSDSDNLFFYRFTNGNDLDNFIDAIREIRHQSIKNALQKSLIK